MSDIEIKYLQDENTKLANQIAVSEQNNKGLLAQIDAHKQMTSELITNSLVHRTNIIFLQNTIKELSAKLEDANKRAELMPQ